MTTYPSDVDAAKALQKKYEALRKEVAKVIVGQDEVVHQSLVAIFS